MAVIKCSNCENEILDTEIVCPYCDCPVSTTKKIIAEKQKYSAMSGETVKIASAKDFENEKEAVLNAPRQDAPEEVGAVPNAADDVTMKISKDDIQSDTLRRSLEERRAGKEALSRKISGRKDHKIAILAITIVGIFVIIYLVVSVFNKIIGEGLFEEEKGNKRAKKEVSSAAEMLELGFEFHSHTLTITDESIVMTDYRASDEKPWKDYIKDTNNLTIADGIETIGAHAFDDLSKIRHVTLASSVSFIGDSAFYACSNLEKIAFDSEKSDLKSVGNYAFTDCNSLETVTFGSELKRIGEGAFKSCENLEEVTIPDSTTEIGADAFLGCPKLVIVCSADSYAYEYATQNGITVKLTEEEKPDDEDETPAQPSATENETPLESKPSKSDNKPATAEPSAPSETTPDNGATQPAKTKDERLSELMSQLGKAQTQEESDKILKEIDELTK